MNFGFIAAAMTVLIVAFLVATTHEEIRANTPPSRGIVAEFHGHKRHHVKIASEKIANERHGPGHSAVASLGGDAKFSFH